jgi:hypothetical protein
MSPVPDEKGGRGNTLARLRSVTDLGLSVSAWRSTEIRLEGAGEGLGRVEAAVVRDLGQRFGGLQNQFAGGFKSFAGNDLTETCALCPHLPLEAAFRQSGISRDGRQGYVPVGQPLTDPVTEEIDALRAGLFIRLLA